MRLAVLYPKVPVPVMDQVVTSLRPYAGLSSSASIACSFGLSGLIPVVTPKEYPDVQIPTDWVFSDDSIGIQQALRLGADTFFLNIPLYAEHAVMAIMNDNFCFIGQRILQSSRLGNRFYFASILQEAQYPYVQTVLSEWDCLRYQGPYPAITKPVRRVRGCGARQVSGTADLRNHLWDMSISGAYGKQLITQPFLPGREISVPVFPRGCYPDGLHESAWSLSPILKIGHVKGVSPQYMVPVTADSCMQEIREKCEAVVDLLNLRGPTCFECRQDSTGRYQIFDIDLQPDLSVHFPFQNQPGRNLFLSAFLYAEKTTVDYLRYLLCTVWPGKE